MAYVVMDMEWNQAMSSQSAVFYRLPIHLRGEIIQIGAVKLTDDFAPAEEFQIDVKPVYFRKMHYKVEKLTGIDAERLEGGVGFKEAFAKFREWCGEDCTFITWGCDDQPIMEQNIIIHDLDWDWIKRWINLQIIYNIQENAGRNQTGLAIAMEHFDIEQTRTAHDALGDAYNTALICSKLSLEEGLKSYDSASKVLPTKVCSENSKSDMPDAVDHRAFTGFDKRSDVFSDVEVVNVKCPVCGKKLKNARWVNQGDKRYMTLGSCEMHGKYLVRLKFRITEDDTWTVNRIVYKADKEMVTFYNSKSHRNSRRRSHRKNKSSTI